MSDCVRPGDVRVTPRALRTALPRALARVVFASALAVAATVLAQTPSQPAQTAPASARPSGSTTTVQGAPASAPRPAGSTQPSAPASTSGTTGRGAGMAQRPADPNDKCQGIAWWRSEPFQKVLGLAPDQVKEIERIWQEISPQLRQFNTDIDLLQDRLSRFISKNYPEHQILLTANEVESKRS